MFLFFFTYPSPVCFWFIYFIFTYFIYLLFIIFYFGMLACFVCESSYFNSQLMACNGFWVKPVEPINPLLYVFKDFEGAQHSIAFLWFCSHRPIQKWHSLIYSDTICKQKTKNHAPSWSWAGNLKSSLTIVLILDVC